MIPETYDAIIDASVIAAFCCALYVLLALVSGAA